MVTSFLFCDASIDRKWNSAILNEQKSPNNFEMVGITEKTCTDSRYKVAVAESVGDVTFVLRCFHGSEVGLRHYLTNDNHINTVNNRVYRGNIWRMFSQSRDREIKRYVRLEVKVSNSVH
jgi:hypothetical protein